MPSLFDRFLHRRAAALWSRLAEGAGSMDAEELRHTRGQARQLRRQIERVLTEADARLTLPAVGGDMIPAVAGADWSWRPEAWRAQLMLPGVAGPGNEQPIGGGLSLYHDCARREMTLRQVRNRGRSDIAPYGLQLDTLGFSGSFLSLAIDLPQEIVSSLESRHIVTLNLTSTTERPARAFARLNVKQGPNPLRVANTLELGGEVRCEFDLGHSGLRDGQSERAWLDLIFEAPGMNAIMIRDVTMSRRRRAAL